MFELYAGGINSAITAAPSLKAGLIFEDFMSFAKDFSTHRTISQVPVQHKLSTTTLALSRACVIAMGRKAHCRPLVMYTAAVFLSFRAISPIFS